MKWTQQKPTVEGSYWVGYDYVNGFGAEIKYCLPDDDEETHMCWLPEWDDGEDWYPVENDDKDTWYYGPLTHPPKD